MRGVARLLLAAAVLFGLVMRTTVALHAEPAVVENVGAKEEDEEKETTPPLLVVADGVMSAAVGGGSIWPDGPRQDTQQQEEGPQEGLIQDGANPFVPQLVDLQHRTLGAKTVGGGKWRWHEWSSSWVGACLP